MIEVLLATSVIVNIFFIFYIRFLVQNLKFINEGFFDVQELIGGFHGHIESLHELEMFYGDASLQSMIEHSRHVLERIEEYKEVYNVTYQGEEEFDDEKEEI